MAEPALLVAGEGFIRTLTINRPERRNALNLEVLEALADTLESFQSYADVRAVVLRGAGEQSFCSGMDLGSSAQESGGRRGASERAFKAVLDCPAPIIAMIYGFAVGAGCDLAVTCDFRVAADTARIGINPVKLGLVYNYRSIQKFVGLFGGAAAKEIFLTGRFMEAQRAREIGLVHFVAPEAELPKVTYALAQELAQNGPLAMAGTKRIINRHITDQRLAPEIETEFQAIVDRAWNSEDNKEARRAFAEKRKPAFQGR
ncbi:MAG: enoyl-CoA hydratase/isomerase family protein [Chloroflexi bacterium]|nr:enoyl-CoA hydratase/isomerase family protein [Chloroflexota bacterium]